MKRTRLSFKIQSNTKTNNDNQAINDIKEKGRKRSHPSQSNDTEPCSATEKESTSSNNGKSFSKIYNSYQKQILEKIQQKKAALSAKSPSKVKTTETTSKKNREDAQTKEKTLSSSKSKSKRHRHKKDVKKTFDQNTSLPASTVDLKENETVVLKKSAPIDFKDNEPSTSRANTIFENYTTASNINKGNNSMERRFANLKKKLNSENLKLAEDKLRAAKYTNQKKISSNNILKLPRIPKKPTVEKYSETKKIDPKKSKRENIQDQENINSENVSMDWEETNESFEIDSVNTSENIDDRISVVVDTNVLLHNLRTIENIVNDDLKVDSKTLNFVIPWRVLCELDGLKGGSVGSDARKALKFLNECLKSNKITGQSLKDSNDHIFDCPTSDDEILNCCLQLVSKKKNVILLTNDINLCNKAITNNVKSFTHDDFVQELNDKDPMVLEISHSDNSNVVSSDVQVLNIQYKHLNKLLSTILKQEMMDRYDNLWIKIVLLEPPWSVSDAIKCIQKHWIAVFSEIFPRSFLDVLVKLQKYLTENKTNKPNDNKNSEIRDLIMEVCHICETLPTYKKIAELCSEEMNTNSTKNILPHNPVKQENYPPKLDQIPVADNSINNAFNFIRKGFQAFCSQLADLVGIVHEIEKTDIVIPIPTLLANANGVSSQLFQLTNILHRTLLIFATNSTATEFEINEILSQLREAIKTTALGMGHEFNCTEKDVASFCILQRLAMEGLYFDFSKLYELLLECSKKCANK